MGGLSPEQVIGLYIDRKKARAPMLDRAREILDHYEGNADVVLPEIDQYEKPAIANMINQGIDQTGIRIASTVPDVTFPALKPGQQTSEKRATKRRSAVLGWWEDNDFDLKLHRRARWLIAYASAPVLLRPDFDRQIPRWELRSPLSTFPPPSGIYDDLTPRDCLFAFDRSFGWVNESYPEHAGAVRAMYAPDAMGRTPVDTKLTLVEYVSGDQYTTLLTGTCAPDRTYDCATVAYGGETRWAILLENVENRSGLCPAVVPGRIGLETSLGQFDGMIGLFQLQAKMMALEVHAVMNSVWPEAWLVARPNEQAEILTVPDGIRGIVGEVKGGDVQYKNVPPGFQTYPTIDRLERSQRLSGGIPAEFGGEAASNIRTGRRGDQVLSAIIDFPILESQRVIARSLKAENVRAIAISKAYFGKQAKSFYVSWRGAKGFVDYVPNDIFETDAHEVHYAHPGADANGLVIGGGQRIQIGTLSKRGFMRMDPMIDDPEEEHDQVIYEGLESSVIAEIQQPGAMPLVDKARVGQLVLQDKSLFEAVLQAQKEAQERQSSTVNPAAPGSPEAMPGLSQPGQGAESGTQGPPPGLENMTQMLGALRLGQRQLPQERLANFGAQLNG